jgi:hypothetical protein
MRRRQLLSGLGGVALSLCGSRVRGAEKLFRVGYLDPASKAPISEGNFDEFRKALIALGYEDGRNVAFEVRWANGKPKGKVAMTNAESKRQYNAERKASGYKTAFEEISASKKAPTK